MGSAEKLFASHFALFVAFTASLFPTNCAVQAHARKTQRVCPINCLEPTCQRTLPEGFLPPRPSRSGPSTLPTLPSPSNGFFIFHPLTAVVPEKEASSSGDPRKRACPSSKAPKSKTQTTEGYFSHVLAQAAPRMSEAR
jgi:hypothetical protein